MLLPTYRNIVERNMLRALRCFATCCDMLGIENRTKALEQVQRCMNLLYELQRRAT